MKIVQIPTKNPIANCYLVGSGKECAVVDPCGDAQVILDTCTENGWGLKYILVTHCHYDHVLSADTLRKKTGTALWVHQEEFDFLEDDQKNVSYLFSLTPITFTPADRTYSDGFTFPIGEEKLTVVHTPGHTIGSSCFLGEDFALVGDTLFEGGGYGRTDLYSGDLHTIFHSLQKLMPMVEGKTLYPGHGKPFVLDSTNRKGR